MNKVLRHLRRHETEAWMKRAEAEARRAFPDRSRAVCLAASEDVLVIDATSRGRYGLSVALPRLN